jgi:hypothetical protein
MKSQFPVLIRYFLAAACMVVLGLAPVDAFSAKVIGEVESVYLQRASIRVLEIPEDASGTCPIKVGQKVSFNLPPLEKKGRRTNAKAEYGKVYEVELTGSPITEYGAAAEGDTNVEGSADRKREVYVWTATFLNRVKDQKKYKPEDDDGKKGKRGRGRKSRKDKEQPKIWTQQETVRGTILVKKERLFLKENGLRPRDTGLRVESPEWVEKLTPLQGQAVVISGTTNRTSPASGTLDIENLIKVYPR